MSYLLLHHTIFLPLKSVQRLKLNKESFNDSAIADCTRASHNRQRAHAMENCTQLKSMRVIRVHRARHRKEEEVLYFREGDHVFTRRGSSRKPSCAAKGWECSSSLPRCPIETNESFIVSPSVAGYPYRSPLRDSVWI